MCLGTPAARDQGRLLCTCRAAAITRERSLLLVLPRDRVEHLFNGEDAGSRVFLDVIQRDLVATLRQALRPHARLAASV